MARNLDKYKDKLAEFAQVSADYQKSGQKYRRLEAKKKRLNDELVQIMGKSTVGELDGKPTLETFIAERDGVTVERVSRVCPQFYDQLVITSKTPKVRFIKGI